MTPGLRFPRFKASISCILTLTGLSWSCFGFDSANIFPVPHCSAVAYPSLWLYKFIWSHVICRYFKHHTLSSTLRGISYIITYIVSSIGSDLEKGCKSKHLIGNLVAKPYNRIETKNSLTLHVIFGEDRRPALNSLQGTRVDFIYYYYYIIFLGFISLSPRRCQSEYIKLGEARGSSQHKLRAT